MTQFYSCYRTLRVGTSFPGMKDGLWRGSATVERQREKLGWREEGKNKGESRESGMENFMLAVYVQTAVTEQLGSLETLSDSSVKAAAPAPVFV